ncbi:hypothetical protein OC25_18820 [Pedobacter kyungheensis]|uniref:Uncharacterized protein n=1 Tax=Pedobacter kyungheensis TaxID=1069985 RepID=A0A0C1FVU9_9SPHI|nr:hypothetical protein OC25_18820 [Pedobacter kyungheensis]
MAALMLLLIPWTDTINLQSICKSPILEFKISGKKKQKKIPEAFVNKDLRDNYHKVKTIKNRIKILACLMPFTGLRHLYRN